MMPIVIVAVVLTWNRGTDLADFVVRLFYGTLVGSFSLLGLAPHYQKFERRKYARATKE